MEETEEEEKCGEGVRIWEQGNCDIVDVEKKKISLAGCTRRTWSTVAVREVTSSARTCSGLDQP